MKISIGQPPIWDEASKLFNLEALGLVTVFTFGDTLYNPYGARLSRDLIAHEEEHARQQKHDDECAKAWWRRYIDDPAFRIDQEAQAYRVQYKCICSIVKDRNMRARHLHEIATIFSGPMYGNIIKYAEAQILIKS